MPLRTTKKVPPGGWIYVQKESGWRLRDFGVFTDACKQIASHRRANGLPRPALNECAEDLEIQTCERLGFDPQWCFDDSKKNSTSLTELWQAAKSHVARVGELLSKGNVGRKILTEWLGEGGKPVPAPQSQERANACTGKLTGKACPHNESGHSFVEWAANILAEQFTVKREMGLSVEGEERLHVCNLCWCALALKVHVPLSHIAQNTPQPMMDQFLTEAPDFCWIKRELKTQENPAK